MNNIKCKFKQVLRVRDTGEAEARERGV